MAKTKKAEAKKPAAKGKAVKEVKEEVKAKGKGKAVKEEAPVEKATKGKEKAPAKGKGKEAAPAKKEAKKETKPRGRGRQAGVRSEVTKKDADAIQAQFSEIENAFDELAENINKFLGGNKSSVGKARKSIQTICRMGKTFRKTLQDSKGNMKTVAIK